MDSGAYRSATCVFISSTIFFAIGNRHFGYTACSVYPPSSTPSAFPPPLSSNSNNLTNNNMNNDNNKPIHIVYYSEVIDNYGRTESSSKGAYIYNALMNMDEWSDDILFEDPAGNKYFIDDLVGKSVSVPDIGIFTVPHDFD